MNNSPRLSTNLPTSFFHLHADVVENTGAELTLPPISVLFQLENLIPLLVYIAIFQLFANYVKLTTWRTATGFRQYRLRNMTVCLVHSSLSGLFALWFALTNAELMLDHAMVIHWYTH